MVPYRHEDLFMTKRIYIADDDENIRFLIGSFLRNEGFEVKAFPNGDELFDCFIKEPADMVILDIMMDGTSGLNICIKIREQFNVPIIIVSARDSELDRITGITLGSDDYLTKPFSPIELMARVKALFRRISFDSPNLNKLVLEMGDIKLDLNTHEFYINNVEQKLTPTEFALMSYLLQHKDRAVSRSELLKNVWKFDFEADTRATDDILKRLRKKIVSSNVKIESVWGYGFKLSIEVKL